MKFKYIEWLKNDRNFDFFYFSRSDICFIINRATVTFRSDKSKLRDQESPRSSERCERKHVEKVGARLPFNFQLFFLPSNKSFHDAMRFIFAGIGAVTRGHGFYRKRGKDRGRSERGEEYRRERRDKLAANVEAILEATSGLRYGTTARIGRWISCFATMVSQRIEKRYRRSDSSRPRFC